MASHLMAGLSRSHEVAAASLYPSVNSPIEHRLRRVGVTLWQLGKRPGFDPRMFGALDRLIREMQPQVLHSHMSVLRYALPALLRHHVPVAVHTLHNLAEHESDTFGRFLQWFAFRRRCVLPIAISREVASSVKRVYGLESHAVVPNGIPVNKYAGSLADRISWRNKERFPDDAVLFTCVGRLEPQKNPAMLVRAFASLNDSRAHLVMLGQGSLREWLVSYIRELGLEQRVHLLGHRPEVRECLAGSDVFVLSSNWEGNPLAVMEAMAAGLPVVGTTVGGVPELVESGRQGFLVAPEDHRAFSTAMQILLGDAKKRAGMGDAARIRATEAFDVEQMVQSYAGIYRNALAENVRQAYVAAA